MISFHIARDCRIMNYFYIFDIFQLKQYKYGKACGMRINFNTPLPSQQFKNKKAMNC